MTSRHGTKWTREENNTLIEMFSRRLDSPLDLTVIAAAYGRDERAILYRIHKLCPQYLYVFQNKIIQMHKEGGLYERELRMFSTDKVHQTHATVELDQETKEEDKYMPILIEIRDLLRQSVTNHHLASTTTDVSI